MQRFAKLMTDSMSIALLVLMVALATGVARADGRRGFHQKIYAVPTPGKVTIDGGLLPEPPQDAIAAGVAAGKELLVGTNRDEMKLWVIGNRRLTGGDEAFILERLEATVGDAAKAAEALAAYKERIGWLA